MSKKSKYPKGWYHNSPPKFYGKKPSKTLEVNTIMHTIPLWDGSDIENLQEGLKYRFSLEYDYGDCYYPSDERSATCSLVGYTEEVIDNPYYKSELARYNRDKKKHDEAMLEWNKWKAIWDEDEAKEKVFREKAELERLKKLYELHPTN